jgi:hypothetical protein
LARLSSLNSVDNFTTQTLMSQLWVQVHIENCQHVGIRVCSGLVPTDDVKMEYTVISDPDNVGLGEAFKSQAQA